MRTLVTQSSYIKCLLYTRHCGHSCPSICLIQSSPPPDKGQVKLKAWTKEESRGRGKNRDSWKATQHYQHPVPCTFLPRHAFSCLYLFSWGCHYKEQSTPPVHTCRACTCHSPSTGPDSLSSALSLRPSAIPQRAGWKWSLSAWGAPGFPQS